MYSDEFHSLNCSSIIVVWRFGLCTIDPYGIHPTDLEVQRLLNLSFGSAALRCERSLVLIGV